MQRRVILEPADHRAQILSSKRVTFHQKAHQAQRNAAYLCNLQHASD